MTSGKPHLEPASLAGLTFDLDPSTQLTEELGNDAEAKSKTTPNPGGGPVCLVEAIEDAA
jgi:hypothetical protein